MEIIQTHTVLPKDKPEKRLETSWQLKEILESTLPHKLFEIPKNTMNGRTAFGTCYVEDTINPDFLFGTVEIKKMTSLSGLSSQVMFIIEMYTKTEKEIGILAKEFREETIYLVDHVTDARISFSDSLSGGIDYIPKIDSVDLTTHAPDLYQRLKPQNSPMYYRFMLGRVYNLGKETSGDTLDCESFFKIV